jgi:hypothetical protein
MIGREIYFPIAAEPVREKLAGASVPKQGTHDKIRGRCVRARCRRFLLFSQEITGKCGGVDVTSHVTLLIT